MRGILWCSELAVVNHENGVLILDPIARETSRKALREKVDVVAAIGAVPIRVIVYDNVHSGLKVGADAVEVIGLVCDEIAGSVDGDVEKVGLLWILCSHGTVEEEAMDMNFGRVKILVAARIADGTGVANAGVDEIRVKMRGKGVDIYAETLASEIRVGPSLQVGNEGERLV